MSTTLNVMIIGGDVHQFEGGCYFVVEAGWLIVHNEHSQAVAVYAEHRTVRAWYDGIGPKIIKA